MPRKETTLNFKKTELRATPSSALGKVIDYLKASAVDNKQVFTELLMARYLPFVLDKDSPEYEEKVLNSINTLKAWILTIEQFSGIEVEHNDRNISYEEAEDSEDEEDDDIDSKVEKAFSLDW